MNNKFYEVSQILNEMGFGKAAYVGTKKIIRRMPLGLKAFTVAPIPVIPNAAIGVGTQFARDKTSRKIGQMVARKGWRNASSAFKSAGEKIKGLFNN